ncbi:MAG: two-component system response regulator KdpE [Burkholderiales bacterium]|nr:two-component system response regulator KdpE [Burkholderiales bacterium]
MNEIRVLIVEDEDNIRRLVRLTLQAEGYEVFEAATLQRGLIEAGTRRPDILVLDLGLPDGDGVDLIRDLRNWSTIPVIVLSARSAEAEKITALDAGADDYLVKPFGAGELLARVRAQLRRHQGQAQVREQQIRYGDVVIDTAKRTVTRDDVPLHLTPIEYRLLCYLVANPEKVLTHKQLLLAVWGPGHANDTHYVRVHMANLRKKVERDSARPKHLLTETGIGYRFVVSVPRTHP